MPSYQGKRVSISDRYLEVELIDGRIISTPIRWYPELQRGTLEQLIRWRFICDSTGLEWAGLNYQLSIEAMFAGEPQRQPASCEESLSSQLGSGKGGFATPQEVDDFIRKERDEC